MRIAMVSDDISPLATCGRADTDRRKAHSAELFAALARAGHDVTVYTRRDNPDLPERVTTAHGYTVVHVPAGPAAPLVEDEVLPTMGTFAGFLEADWMRHRPDVAHAHSWTSGIATQLAARALSLPTVQTFATLSVAESALQSGGEMDLSSRMRLERVLAKGAHHVVATCSEQVFELSRMGLPRTRASVVPSGVDVDHFTVAGFGTVPSSRGRYRLVAAGRPAPEDGFDTAVTALSLLPDTELVIAGGAAHDDAAADETDRLLALADELGVRERVHMEGHVTRDRMPALLRSADVVLCPSRYEPFGIVALEAMACGRPVVATAVASLRDIVVDGVTGLLVPPRSPHAVATAVRELIADPVQHALSVSRGAIVPKRAIPGDGPSSTLSVPTNALSGSPSPNPSRSAPAPPGREHCETGGSERFGPASGDTRPDARRIRPARPVSL